MSNKNEVFEYLIYQLRQCVSKFDVVAEIHKMSIDRSITGRSGYSDVENAIIDAYIGRDSDSEQIIHNLKQHLASRDGDIRMLKDRLRRAKDKIKELRVTIEHMNIDFYRVTKREECEHYYRLVLWSSDLKQCTKCGAVLNPQHELYDGWIENPGRKACPVPSDCEVEVQYLGGLSGKGLARNFRWDFDNDNWDIVKYRVIK